MPYHINPETGEVGRCRAVIKCSFGQSPEEHLNTMGEAIKVSENLMKEKFENFTSLTKKKKQIVIDPDDYFSDESSKKSVISMYENSKRRWLSRAAEGKIPEKDWQKWQKENPGLARTPVPDAPKKVSVFRTGLMKPSELIGESAYITDLADAERGEGDPTRNGSLFASPDIKASSRWMNTSIYNESKEAEMDRMHEVVVDPNKVLVYHVSSWEDVSWQGAPPEEFWNSGMLLSRWQQAAAENNWDSSEWEVIFPAEEVIDDKNVTAAKLKKLGEGIIEENRLNEMLEKTKKVQKELAKEKKWREQRGELLDKKPQ